LGSQQNSHSKGPLSPHAVPQQLPHHGEGATFTQST
jgi:hypothetical protein